MDEDFLHFVWKYQYFNTTDLTTTDGHPVTIFKTGHHNTDAGPDFNEARIRINDIVWTGNIEVHIFSEDWSRHGHHHDKQYDNVILHVVWKNDVPAKRSDGSFIPTIELMHLIKPALIRNYHKLIQSHPTILCSSMKAQWPELSLASMLDKTIAVRLNKKAHKVFDELDHTGNDWEETTYRLLAVNFGLRINTIPFLNLARSLPLKIIKRHANRLNEVEALLFGQAGFLSGTNKGAYFLKLKTDYQFYKKKYNLRQLCEAFQWKFLRLRPASFPTIRIAQFAALLCQQPNLFSMLHDFHTQGDLLKTMDTQQSEYWQQHYHFGKKAKSKFKKIGLASRNGILINTLVPILYAHGQYLDEDDYSDKALDLLQQLKPEKNHIIALWEQTGVQVSSAFDSQALLELHNEFCKKKRCLNCTIGAGIIHKEV